MVDKSLTSKETLALIHAKNEILALKNQIMHAEASKTPHDYFVKFQREIDMFEKKIGTNINNMKSTRSKSTNSYRFLVVFGWVDFGEFLMIFRAPCDQGC